MTISTGAMYTGRHEGSKLEFPHRSYIGHVRSDLTDTGGSYRATTGVVLAMLCDHETFVDTVNVVRMGIYK